MIQAIDQIKSVMLGHAIADALGVPVEFSTRSKLEKTPVTQMMGYGTYPVPAGAWSDDTSMAVAALDCIADGELNWESVMTAFGEWYYHDQYTPTGELFDIGNICSKAIHNYHVLQKSVNECGLKSEYSNGNGSLMRIHPFSLLTWYDSKANNNWEEIIDQASSLTHAHERSRLACKIYTLILHKLLEAPCKQSVYSALETAKDKFADHTEGVHYLRLWEKDLAELPSNEIRSGGYVVDSIEAAVWCLLTTDNYRDCVLKAVNLGEDTDTTAAIAGGLAGALYGLDAIEQEWLDTLLRRDYIEEMCERAAKKWCVSR